MTSDGSPHARFRRAIALGNLALARAAASELPGIDLADALAVCLLMQDGEQGERAAARWLGRFALETPTAGIEDLRDGLVAFEALPFNPDGARRALGDLCERHGIRVG